jgi:peroxiredoxin
MKIRTRTGDLAICSLAGLLLCLGSPVAAETLAEGDPAPSFQLPDIWDRETFTSDSLLSQEPSHLLILWNTECPDCLAAVVGISDILVEADSLALPVIGICTDKETIGDARRFVRAMKLPFLNLWDANRTVAAAYGAGEVSFSAFLIDAEHRIRLAQYDHPESPEAFLDAIQSREAGTGNESSDHRDGP